jgi:Aspartyl protease
VPVEFTAQAPNTTLVQACVGGHGPFPFIIDTGSAGTFISRSVASRLGLPPLGTPTSFGSEGCRGSTQPVRLPPLAVGRRVIAPSTGYTIAVKGFGGPGEPVGTLGANALSSLGPIKLDYLRRQLSIAPRITKDGHEPHSPFQDIPSRWLTQKAQIVAPLTVIHKNGTVSLRVAVSLHGGETHEWLPDTGSQTSIVDNTSVSASHLKYAAGSEHTPSLCSNTPLTTRRAWSGRWELSGHRLRPELLQVSSVSRTVGGVDGILGGSTFIAFGSVVFDWPDHLLLLGAG